jgi:hypothetical protein
MTPESSIPSIRPVSLGLATFGLALVAAFAFASFALSARGPAAVLYDQMSGVPGGLVASEQSIVASTNDCLRPLFTPIDAQDCIAADDFTVPPGPAWNVTGIRAEGQGGAGADFRFELFKDVAGLPFSPSSARLGTGERPAPKPGSGNVVFRAKKWSRGYAALPPGTYWLAVYADGLQNEESATSWYWRSQVPQVGREAVWGRQCGETSEVWSYLSACGQTGPDLRFRLEGERMTRRFSSFRFVGSRRKQNGGLTLFARFPGPGRLSVGGVVRNGRTAIEARTRPVIEDGRIPIQVNPTPAVKQALKAGGKVRTRAVISFVRAAGVRQEGPSSTRVLQVLLDKPGA